MLVAPPIMVKYKELSELIETMLQAAVDLEGAADDADGMSTGASESYRTSAEDLRKKVDWVKQHERVIVGD